jgi:hypothetical protein
MYDIHASFPRKTHFLEYKEIEYRKKIQVDGDKTC